MKVSDWILKLRHDLNDIERDWFENDEILISYFNEGLCQVHSFKPEFFAKSVVTKLVAGNLQQLPNCCKLFSVDAITDVDGAWLADVQKSNQDLMKRWTEPCCQTKNTNSIARSYYKATQNSFVVMPPVNGDVYARVTVSCKPEGLPFELDANADFDCSVGNSAYQWALHRAFGVAHDSASSISRSNIAKQTFFELLNIELSTDKRIQR